MGQVESVSANLLLLLTYFLETGAAEETRTPDPIITNDVLYHLSYSGDSPAHSTGTLAGKDLFFRLGVRQFGDWHCGLAHDQRQQFGAAGHGHFAHRRGFPRQRVKRMAIAADRPPG